MIRKATTAAHILAADCPWQFGDKLPGGGRGAAKHYSTLPVNELQRFELPPIADDAWLFLWRVSAMPQEALDVAKAWGFRVVSEVVWVKAPEIDQAVRRGTKRAARLDLENDDVFRVVAEEARHVTIGMGHSVRMAHEVCLIAKRGRPTRNSPLNVPSVFFAPRGEHSAKPDAFYALVERFAPGPYVELFARRRRAGWDCYGDELT
jgi:N6-adenosine-specific RNA methylase IME4